MGFVICFFLVFFAPPRRIRDVIPPDLWCLTLKLQRSQVSTAEREPPSSPAAGKSSIGTNQPRPRPHQDCRVFRSRPDQDIWRSRPRPDQDCRYQRKTTTQQNQDLFFQAFSKASFKHCLEQRPGPLRLGRLVPNDSDYHISSSCSSRNPAKLSRTEEAVSAELIACAHCWNSLSETGGAPGDKSLHCVVGCRQGRLVSAATRKIPAARFHCQTAAVPVCVQV